MADRSRVAGRLVQQQW